MELIVVYSTYNKNILNRVIYQIEKKKEKKINNSVILIGNKIDIIEREISKIRRKISF